MQDTSDNTQHDLLTVEEASAAVRRHPRTIRRHVRDGSLRAYQFGGEGPWLIDRRDLDAALIAANEHTGSRS